MLKGKQREQRWKARREVGNGRQKVKAGKEGERGERNTKRKAKVEREGGKRRQKEKAGNVKSEGLEGKA
jgi:hypothetical protein